GEVRAGTHLHGRDESPVAALHAEARPAIELSAAQAPREHRREPVRIIVGGGRPERLLVVADGALEVARVTPPAQRVPGTNRGQACGVMRAGRKRSVELEVEERLEV